MTDTVSLRGVVPVVPTPFRRDESIDIESLARIVDWIASMPLAGLCIPAYGSEFYKLDEVERDKVVSVAVEVSDGRVPVIAQANHSSAHVATELVRRYTSLGADAVSFAIPRQFGASEADIIDYCERVTAATSLSILVQDFNPGGPTISVELISELCERSDNLRFVKLEDPMMLDKLIAIRSATAGQVSILEGWGGLYMLEGIAAGIDGIMPGAAIADLLDCVFDAAKSQQWEKAHDLFGVLLPYINFALQDFELFLQIEKRTLKRRGLLHSSQVRSLSRTPSPATLSHIDFLIDQLERHAGKTFGVAWS